MGSFFGQDNVLSPARTCIQQVFKQLCRHPHRVAILMQALYCLLFMPAIIVLIEFPAKHLLLRDTKSFKCHDISDLRMPYFTFF